MGANEDKAKPVVTTWDTNARNYSVSTIIQALDGWSTSAKKLARASQQPEATAAAKAVCDAVGELEDLLQQPVVKKGTKAPKAEDLDAYGVRLG